MVTENNKALLNTKEGGVQLWFFQNEDQTELTPVLAPQNGFTIIAMLHWSKEIYILQHSTEQKLLKVSIRKNSVDFEASGEFTVKCPHRVIKAVNCKEMIYILDSTGGVSRISKELRDIEQIDSNCIDMYTNSDTENNQISLFINLKCLLRTESGSLEIEHRRQSYQQTDLKVPERPSEWIDIMLHDLQVPFLFEDFVCWDNLIILFIDKSLYLWDTSKKQWVDKLQFETKILLMGNQMQW